MLQQNPTTGKDQWELIGIIAGATVSLVFLIGWPLRWLFRLAWVNALRESQADVRACLDVLYAKEIGQREEIAETVKANEQRIEYMHEALLAHGLALREVPKMSGVLEQVASAVERLDETLKTMASQQLDHTKELGRVTGFIDAGEWKGDERRRKGRRHEDPPVEGG